MGDNQKIDLLFQEKLSNMEMVPSEQAWISLQRQMATTHQVKKPVWYYAAAAIAILIASLVFLLNQTEETKTYLVGYTDYPIRPSETSWSIHIPERPENKPKPEKSSPEKSSKTEVAATPIIASSQKEQPEVHMVEMPNLEVKVAQSLAIQTPDNFRLEGIESTEITNVKITYISGEKKSEPTGSVSLAKVLNAAQQVSPSDLLADLREAKNQFLSRN